jgi:protein gp37
MICANCCAINTTLAPPSCCDAPAPTPLTRVPRSLAGSMTNISWASFSLNAWGGCTPIPASSGGRSGCEICYARSFLEKKNIAVWGAGEPRRLFKGWPARARRLDRMARDTGLRFSVFAFSLADWLDPEVDPSWRAAFTDVVEDCPHLDWLLLTHRPHLAAKFAPAHWRRDLPDNVWPGVTLEHTAHGFRFTQLADLWGGTNRLWVSAEPLAGSLAALDLSAATCVIIGGASNTRDPSWALNPNHVSEIVTAYPNRVHFKQWGVFGPDGVYNGAKALNGRAWNGTVIDWTPWPRHRALLASIAANRPAPIAERH